MSHCNAVRLLNLLKADALGTYTFGHLTPHIFFLMAIHLMQSNLAQFREFPNLSALSIRRLSGERPSLEAKSGVGRFSQGVAIFAIETLETPKWFRVIYPPAIKHGDGKNPAH